MRFSFRKSGLDFARYRHLVALITVSASKATAAVLALATAAIVARAYGQAGLGIFALLRIAPSVLMVLTDPGFSHSVPFLKVNRKVCESRLICSGLCVYAAVSLIQITVWLVCGRLIHDHLLPLVSTQSIYTAAILAPIQSISIFLVNIIRARLKYDVANASYVVGEAALLVLVYLSILNGDAVVDGITMQIVSASAISMFYSAFYVFRDVKNWKGQFSLSVIVEGLTFGVRSQIGNAFQILNYRLDQLLLGFYLTPQRVALYFIATKSIEFFRFFTASVVFIFEPIFASQKGADAKGAVARMFMPLFICNSVLLAVGIVVAPFVYPLVFGSWSREATSPLLILGMGLAISGANGLFNAYFLGQGRPGVTTLASLTGLVITVILTPILIPKLDIVGAAIASSLTYAAVTAAYVGMFLKLNPDHRNRRASQGAL